MRSSAGLCVLLAVSALALPRAAFAFCRTTTCPLPPDWSPTAGCLPTNFEDAKGHFWTDFASYCASLDPPRQVYPLWWRNACVSYDVQRNGSRQVSYAAADQIAAAAFSRWTHVACPPTASGATRVSIDAVDLGPVACDDVQYNADQGNQHVLLFCDDAFPCDSFTTPEEATAGGNTLGLTTVTYDATTGEIFDADTEINATLPLSAVQPVPDGSYDLSGIITHEMGHFLGLAHSDVTTATMYAFYNSGMGTLTSDDVAALCTVYPPDGTRSVDPSVSGSGFLTAATCDPTPRHGFQPTCAQSVETSCTVAPAPGENPGARAFAVVLGCLALGARSRRRRPQ